MNVAKVSPWSHEAAKCYWFKRVRLRVGREKLFNITSPASLSFHHAETLWCSQGCDVIRRTRCAELFPPHSWPSLSSTHDMRDAFKTITGYQLLYHHIIFFSSYTFTPPGKKKYLHRSILPPRSSRTHTSPVSRLYFCSLASYFSNFFHILSLVFFLFVCLFWPQNRHSLLRNQRSTSQPRWRRWWTFPVRLEVSCVCVCVCVGAC